MSLRIVRRSAHSGVPLGGQLHPVLERVYAARGVRSEAELDHSLVRLLPVGTLEGIPAAVELLLAHRTGRVLVVGDFDADGATSCALVVRALRACGFACVDFLVPNRFEFGYGLTPEIVALALTRTPSLIVTVDNGISSNAGVAAARERGIEVLITDHHLPGAQLPDANVIVNPNLAGSCFGSRSLAGVGVAFYVMAAVRRALDRGGTISSALIPGTQRPARMRLRPCATSTRLLASSGTTSATVPSATRSSSSATPGMALRVVPLRSSARRTAAMT